MAGSGFDPHARCPKPVVSQPVGGAAGRSGFADVGQNALHRFGFGDEAEQPHFGATLGGQSNGTISFRRRMEIFWTSFNGGLGSRLCKNVK